MGHLIEFIRCKGCKGLFLGNAERCPHCLRRNPGNIRQRIGRVAAVILGILALVLAVFVAVRYR
jgi:hypothetical protein